MTVNRSGELVAAVVGALFGCYKHTTHRRRHHHPPPTHKSISSKWLEYFRIPYRFAFFTQCRRPHRECECILCFLINPARMSCSFPCVNFYRRWKPPTFWPHARPHTDHGLVVMLINHQHVIALNRQPPFRFCYFSFFFPFFCTMTHYIHTHTHLVCIQIFRHKIIRLLAMSTSSSSPSLLLLLLLLLFLFSFIFWSQAAAAAKKLTHKCYFSSNFWLGEDKFINFYVLKCDRANTSLYVYIWRTSSTSMFSNA